MTQQHRHSLLDTDRPHRRVSDAGRSGIPDRANCPKSLAVSENIPVFGSRGQRLRSIATAGSQFWLNMLWEVRLTLNQRVPGSSPGAPTTQSPETRN